MGALPHEIFLQNLVKIKEKAGLLREIVINTYCLTWNLPPPHTKVGLAWGWVSFWIFTLWDLTAEVLAAAWCLNFLLGCTELLLTLAIPMQVRVG